MPNTKIIIGSTCQLLQGKLLDDVCMYIDEILISMYGISKESYEAIHRGSLDFDKVKNNIDTLLKREKRPYTVLKYLILPENESEQQKWIGYYRDRCDRVDVWKPHNWGGWNGKKPEINKTVKCFRIDKNNSLMLRTNGDVSVCCMDFNHRLVIGNLYDNSLREIINSERMKSLKLQNACGEIYNNPICKNCDQLYDRSDALVYTSGNMVIGEKSSHVIYRNRNKDNGSIL